MPEEVSEAKVETVQVEEEKPSESVEEQVAAPDLSEAEPPAQEPEKEPSVQDALAKLTDAEVEALPDEHPVKRYAKSISDKSILKLRQEFEAREREREEQNRRETQLREARQRREQNQTIYRQLQALRKQSPEQWQQYMDQPQYAAIWNEGLNITPTAEEIDSAKSEGYNEGFNQLWGAVYQGFMQAPEMADLTPEELSDLSSDNFRGKPNPHAAYTLAMAKVYGTRVAKAAFKKELEKAVEDARADERERLQAKYREAGVGPEEIEGKPASSTTIGDIRDRYAMGYIDSETYEREMKAHGANP